MPPPTVQPQNQQNQHQQQQNQNNSRPQQMQGNQQGFYQQPQPQQFQNGYFQPQQQNPNFFANQYPYQQQPQMQNQIHHQQNLSGLGQAQGYNVHNPMMNNPMMNMMAQVMGQFQQLQNNNAMQTGTNPSSTRNGNSQSVHFNVDNPNSRSQRNNDDTASAVLTQALESSILDVSRISETRMHKLHPYAKEFYWQGASVSGIKNLAKFDDWQRVRAFLRWSVTEKAQQDSPQHIKWMSYALSAVSTLAPATNDTTRDTLCGKVMNAVDHAAEQGHNLSFAEIDQLVVKFSTMSLVEKNGPASAGRHSFRAQTHSKSKKGGKVYSCNGYNSSKGCIYENCRYQHVCSNCAEQHPLQKCPKK